MAGIPSEHVRDVREALRIVISDPGLGAATLSNAPAMSNLLKDLLPDAPREKNLLVAAAEASIASMMLDHVGQGINAESAIRLAAASFAANTHFTDAACIWVATELAVALDLAHGLAEGRSELPPGDITTAASPATAAPHPASGRHPAQGEHQAPEEQPAPAASGKPSTQHVAAGQSDSPQNGTARATQSLDPGRSAPAEASTPLRPAAAWSRARAGVGTALALAGFAVLLLACLVPLYVNPYDSSNPVRIWGGGLAWWLISAPTSSVVIAVIAAIAILGRRGAGGYRLRAVSASAALLVCGIQLLFVFESVWQQVAHDGDSLGAGLPLGLIGAALLIAGAAVVLLQLRAADRAVSGQQEASA